MVQSAHDRGHTIQGATVTTKVVGRQCAGTAKATGKRCTRPPIKGGTVCYLHGGSARQVIRKALVRAELDAWGLSDTTEDPGEVILRLLTQSVRRVELYSSLVQEAYAAAEATTDVYAAAWAMPKGVAALIGYKFAFPNRSTTPVPVAEAIRGLVELEAAERDRCLNIAVKAVGAGLAERVVRMQERDARAAHQALMDGLDAAGITGEVRMQVLNGAAASLRLITS